MKTFIALSILSIITATIVAQTFDLSPHIRQLPPPPYNGKTSPPLKLDEAYVKAFSALGAFTNQYYCVGATCLNQLLLVDKSYGQSDSGWMFEFSNTNGDFRRVHVCFDMNTVLVGDGADYQQPPPTNNIIHGF